MINLSSQTYVVHNFKSILVFNYIFFYVLFLCLTLLLLPLYIIKIKGEYPILLEQDAYLTVICTIVHAHVSNVSKKFYTLVLIVVQYI